jgi:glycosyltransferase involved in cell wall biosynthesis
MSKDVQRVVIALATYRREARLAGLLPHLVRQAHASPHQVRILVVDNDGSGSAEPTVRACGSALVSYVHEARPGIAAARNRALSAAWHDDLLVFIDDDEVPASSWLDRLIETWQEWRPAAVAGPVLSSFEGPVSPWVAACPVFIRRRMTTGTTVAGAGAGNLLLDLRQLRALDLGFDDRFGLTGGEDSMLTRSLVARGGQVRWCDEAVVHESVPTDRATRPWALRRAVRTASTWCVITLLLAPSPARRARARTSMLLRAARRMAVASVRLAAARARRDVAASAGAEVELAAGWGMLVGLFGEPLVGYRLD